MLAEEQGTPCSSTSGWQHVPTGALSGKLCESWWVQSLERPWLSAGWIPSLPGRAVRASAPFLHALPCELPCKLLCHALADMPHPVCPPCSWFSWSLALPKSFFYMVRELGCHCSWPCPGLISCCCASCGLLEALSAPPEVPQVQEPPLCTALEHSAADRASTGASCLGD